MMRADGRRLVRALLLGLAVLLFVGGGTGFALAADGAASDGRLQVPAPGPGDRATYEGRTVTLDPDARPLDVAVRMELEWLPAVRAVGSDFVVRDAHPLRSAVTWAVGLPHEGTYVRTAYYDAATGDPMLRMVNDTMEVDDGWNYGVVLDDAAGAPPARIDYLYEVFTGRIGECGMRVPFQGKTFHGAPFTTMGVCTWTGPVTYRPLGWTGRGDERPYTFAAEEDERFQVAYTSGSPFPARFHSTLNVDLLPPDWAFGRHIAFERVAWQPSGLAYGEPGAGEDVGRAHLAERTPWMVDDTGVEHPFPLREAFAAALAEADPTTGLPTAPGDGPTTVSEFYALHPEAYLAVAKFEFIVDRKGEPHPNWKLAFTDGHDLIARRVERGPPAIVDGMVYLPSEAGTQDRVYPWEDPQIVPDDATGVFPPPARIPSSMPRVTDVMARYELLTGRPASAYGLDIRCADAACASVEAHVAAGQSRADLETLASSAASPVVAARTVFDHIWVADDGTLTSRVSFDKEHAGRVHLVPSQVEEREATTPTAQVAAGTLWHAPPAAAVASVSFVAALASLLYYFWPGIKGAALGLFSRTRDDALLEHPRRAQVVQVVQAQPGIHFQDLARTLGIGRGNLEHHLRKLVAAQLLTKVHDKGYACYFPKGTVDRRVMAAAPLLRAPGSRAVFQALRANPGLSGRELARRVGLSQSTVSYHLRRLQEAGLVFSAGAGVQLSPLGEQAAAGAA